MAITPRTIFSSPASATVATVALLAFSAVGTLAYQVANRTAPEARVVQMTKTSTRCDSVREVVGPNMARWSENEWIVLASCYENQNDSLAAARVAKHGVHFYPRSETLYNIAGYHEISRGEYSRAIHTLRTGLRNVERPTSGVMANNLAWASLWVPNATSATEARALYQSALRYDTNSCETLHTGLWVEYALAMQNTSGIQQAQALRNFQNLRARYNSCESRVDDGQWKSMVEVVGASVLFEKIDHMLDPSTDLHGAYGVRSEGTQSVARVTNKLRENFSGTSIRALCDEAMPLTSTRADCVKSVSNAVQVARSAEAQRYQRHHGASTRNASKAFGCGLSRMAN
ncbi:hypothetical protein [Bradymonas sediminis]|uniref:hypothetical protein n=1 Tax=Bradymonas sediminis TaxID=1548548 RepID=UPI0010608247|nr:hypothetical protein [Bradymonas sediminis]TDP75462.1 hypothetical protein DFR33_104330 [Bradymonas sediminis]